MGLSFGRGSPAHLRGWSDHSLFVTTRRDRKFNNNKPNPWDSGQGRNFMTSRRTAICLIAMGISSIASVGSAVALDYPTRPVRFVVGYPPGGATDIIARLIGQRLSEKLAQQFVVQTKPGAGNNISTASAIHPAAEPYTL